MAGQSFQSSVVLIQTALVFRSPKDDPPPSLFVFPGIDLFVAFTFVGKRQSRKKCAATDSLIFGKTNRTELKERSSWKVLRTEKEERHGVT